MPTETPAAGAASGARSLPHPDREDIRLAQVLHALADPMRLRIVCALAAAEGELNCADIELPVSKSTCTHHFRVLREHGVIQQFYRGTAKMNGLRRTDLDELFPGLIDGVLQAARLQERRLGAL
ncbi:MULTISPECIES: helix-turn-helix domain-containing protein [Streptomyces]|uniref:DNA-binding transcriptional regulator, ArsR family n=2 Tax=Streptomyces TaxID=1883 RepID=A0A9X8N749_9ACTN|nr:MULTISPECIES: helix-turn-helix domain-containing protein [Streptomyces]AJC54291.1 ArsR-family transcriptional regulator [Streptomyces sp. 769]PNE37723.1 ArsR family transcriptional regulator [Streptomyces noursei]QRX95953.1 winged helix-turn-helix transcriptional regulator [Streptomyces noursei]UJB45284.1 winged helix-turn-helix transcriptional regulator [Streptomyces sp. A1-5]WEB39086.1 helix-turn-helix domain-containing protein [Streptomyces yunnanensis]